MASPSEASSSRGEMIPDQTGSGRPCRFFWKNGERWIEGEITEPLEKGKITVEFKVDGQRLRKRLSPNSIRVAIESDPEGWLQFWQDWQDEAKWCQGYCQNECKQAAFGFNPALAEVCYPRHPRHLKHSHGHRRNRQRCWWRVSDPSSVGMVGHQSSRMHIHV